MARKLSGSARRELVAAVRARYGANAPSVKRTILREFASNNGVHRIVENSGHFIQNDQPLIVIGAIKEILGRVRATTP